VGRRNEYDLLAAILISAAVVGAFIAFLISY